MGVDQQNLEDVVVGQWNEGWRSVGAGGL